MRDTDPPNAETPAEGAARRLVRLTSGRADEADKAELDRWRAADRSNDQAWRDTTGLWRDMGALRRDRRGLARLPAHHLTRRAMIGAAAVGLVGAAGVSWDRGGTELLLADLATGTAETANRTLADGSTLALGARSAADIDFDEGFRRVALRSGALFVTAAADARPFVVEAGTAAIVAEGKSAVAISRRTGGLQVGVAAGSARLGLHAGGATLPVEAAQMVGVTAAGRVEGPRAVAASGIAAWRHGRLVIEDRPLPEVAEELGSYFRGAILLRGAAKRQRVSAALDLADVPAALSALSGVLALELSWPAPRIAILRG